MRILGHDVSGATNWFATLRGSAFCGILGFLIVFSPLIEGGTTQFPVLVIRLTLLAVLMVKLFQGMRRSLLVVPRSPLYLPVVLFLLWACATLFWAPYKNAGLQWFLTLLFYSLLFAFTLQETRSHERMYALVALMLGMGVAEGLFGIIQYAWIGEPRATGTFFNPNFFASYEGAILCLALGMALFMRRTEISQSTRIVLWSAVAIIAVAFVLAQSRGALLAFVVAVVLMGWIRFGKMAVAIGVVILLIGVVIPNPLRNRIADVSSQDPYAYTRLDIWGNTTNRIIEHPLGIGLGMFKYGSFQNRFPIEGNIVRYGKRAESAHNEYLQIGVELGVVGLAIFLGGLALWGRGVREVWRSLLSSNERGLVMGLTAAGIVLLVHAAVDSVFHEPALVITLIMAVAMVHSVPAMKQPERDENVSWKRLPFPYHPVRVSLAVVICLVVGAMCVQQAAGWYAHEQGKSEALLGRSESALEWYARAVTIDPGTTAYHDSVARIAVQLFDQSGNSGWLVRAATEESVAAELNKLDGRFPYRLGTIYSLMAEQRLSRQQTEFLLEQARINYLNAIRADPYSPFAYFELAKIRKNQGFTEEAIALLEEAKRYEPNFLPGRALLAELSLGKGSEDGVRKEFSTMKTILETYERNVLNETERQFMAVDLYPLGRALAMELRR